MVLGVIFCGFWDFFLMGLGMMLNRFLMGLGKGMGNGKGRKREGEGKGKGK